MDKWTKLEKMNKWTKLEKKMNKWTKLERVEKVHKSTNAQIGQNWKNGQLTKIDEMDENQTK